MDLRASLRVSSIVFLTVAVLLNIWHLLVARPSETDSNKKDVSQEESLPSEGNCCSSFEQKLLSGRLIFTQASFVSFIALLLYQLNNMLFYSLSPTEAGCQIQSRLGMVLSIVNKAGLYLYLFARARITVNISSTRYLQFLVFFGIVMETALIILALAISRGINPTNGICEIGPQQPIFGAVFLVTDVVIGVSLLVLFFRPLVTWINEFVAVREGSDEFTRKVGLLAIWAFIAIVSTLISIPLGVSQPSRTPIVIACDQLVNGFCIIQQYHVLAKGTGQVIMKMSKKSEAKSKS